jgi:hypothetical protein
MKVPLNSSKLLVSLIKQQTAIFSAKSLKEPLSVHKMSDLWKCKTFWYKK